MKSSAEFSPLTQPVQSDFLYELTLGNVPRMWWLLVTSTGLSVLLTALNFCFFRRAEFVPWQIFDLAGSLIFFVLFTLADRGRLPKSWIWPLSPAYFAFWLVLMDGYYFNGVPITGEVATYVLGALAPAILIVLPPRFFLALLIPNHLVFCGLVFLQHSRNNLSDDTAFSALLNGTLGALIAGLGAWFLFTATRKAYDKTQQVLAKTRETKLAASHLHAILENIPFQAWLKDTGGTFLAVNHEFARCLDLKAEQILGLTCRDIYPPARANLYMEEDRAIVQSGERVHLEQSVDGETARQWFEVFKSPVLADDGTCLGTAGLARDITQRKHIEELLVAADNAKSDFLATMSHEIRTPMNSVLGYAELLRGTPMDETQREYVASISHSGQLLLSIINDILDFSKIQSGMIALKSEVFRLSDLLDRVMTMFRPLAHQKSLGLTLDKSEDLPQVVRGDMCRIEQLLVNLLSNAVKFTTTGFVRLKVRKDCSPESPWDGVLVFEVEDSGIGIPRDQMERLFKPFSQIDSAMARRFSGTGLGLVIVDRLCQLMGGHVTVKSQYGQGSVFTAAIKLAEAGSAEPKEDASPVRADVGSFELSSCRVLVVEDNASNRKLMGALLARWGIVAVMAEGGEEAVRLVQQQPFDLILMDVQMPGMDGLQATRFIREWEVSSNQPHVRIVALTAFALADDSAKCLKAGMDGHLSKPLNVAALQEVVRQACSEARGL